MQSFKSFLEEAGSQPYHNKKLKLDTPHFEGHAHIKYSKPIGRKHDTHEYTVTYKGMMKNGKPTESSRRMTVKHGPDGTPYEHSIENSKSSNIASVIKKNAPFWVSLSDLKPKE